MPTSAPEAGRAICAHFLCTLQSLASQLTISIFANQKRSVSTWSLRRSVMATIQAWITKHPVFCSALSQLRHERGYPDDACLALAVFCFFFKKKNRWAKPGPVPAPLCCGPPRPLTALRCSLLPQRCVLIAIAIPALSLDVSKPGGLWKHVLKKSSSNAQFSRVGPDCCQQHCRKGDAVYNLLWSRRN